MQITISGTNAVSESASVSKEAYWYKATHITTVGSPITMLTANCAAVGILASAQPPGWILSEDA